MFLCNNIPVFLMNCHQVPGNGWAQIVAFAGYYELFVYKYNGTPGAGDAKGQTWKHWLRYLCGFHSHGNSIH